MTAYVSFTARGLVIPLMQEGRRCNAGHSCGTHALLPACYCLQVSQCVGQDDSLSTTWIEDHGCTLRATSATSRLESKRCMTLASHPPLNVQTRVWLCKGGRTPGACSHPSPKHEHLEHVAKASYSCWHQIALPGSPGHSNSNSRAMASALHCKDIKKCVSSLQGEAW